MPKNNVLIKQLSKIDLSQVIEIQKICFHEFHEEDINIYDNFITVFPDGAWGAFHEDRLVGHIFFHPYKNQKEKPLNSKLVLTGEEDSMYLHEIAILQQYRSHGISKLLLDKFNEISEKYKMMSQTLVSVENSAEFWKKKGFSIIKKADENNYLNGYLMSKQTGNNI